jgi:hypothetical protein
MAFAQRLIGGFIPNRDEAASVLITNGESFGNNIASDNVCYVM